MKKIFFLCISACTFVTFSQNTFPTSGNVGIGTSSPSERLDVNGNLVVDSCLLVKDSVIVEKNLRAKGRFYVEDKAYFLQKVFMYDKLDVTGNISGQNNINAGNNINVVNNANIDNNLNVEGTANLNDIVKMTGLEAVPNLNNPNLEFLVKNQNGKLFKIDVASLITMMYSKECIDGIQDIVSPAWNNGLNKIFVNYPCAGVKVGIRTSDPQYFLDVREMAFLSRLKVGVLQANETGMINGFDPTNSRDLIQLGVLNATTQNQSDVRFRVSNKGATSITNKGTEPSLQITNGTGQAIRVYGNSGATILQLEDNGLLRSREIKVDAESWPDYVFSDDYKLMTLENLALFIEKNNHLPGVPDAKSVEKNGLGVGAMQKAQMEKIEEQALYSIHLNNELKNVKNENLALKSELEKLKAEIEEIKNLLK